MLEFDELQEFFPKMPRGVGIGLAAMMCCWGMQINNASFPLVLGRL